MLQMKGEGFEPPQLPCSTDFESVAFATPPTPR